MALTRWILATLWLGILVFAFQRFGHIEALVVLLVSMVLVAVHRGFTIYSIVASKASHWTYRQALGTSNCTVFCAARILWWRGRVRAIPA